MELVETNIRIHEYHHTSKIIIHNNMDINNTFHIEQGWHWEVFQFFRRRRRYGLEKNLDDNIHLEWVKRQVYGPDFVPEEFPAEVDNILSWKCLGECRKKYHFYVCCIVVIPRARAWNIKK